MGDRYYVYIMSNASRTLYVGMTNDLARRVRAHEQKAVPGFTAKYNVTQLVYFEETSHPQAAIEREKQLKKWRREKKLKLIGAANPTWRDLGAEEMERPFRGGGQSHPRRGHGSFGYRHVVTQRGGTAQG